MHVYMTVKQSFHEWVLLVQNIFKIFHISTFASIDRSDLVNLNSVVMLYRKAVDPSILL